MAGLSFSSLLLALGALIAGAVVPIQAVSNGALARQLGHPLWASLISLLISIVVLVPLIIAFKIPKPTFTSSLLQQPLWIWLGGIAGIFYITAALILVPKIGGTTFFIMVIAGQLIISTLIDHFGLFGIAKQPIQLARLIGVGLVVAGVLSIQLAKK